MKSAKQISIVLLSNDTIGCRINNISIYIKTELIYSLKCTYFSLKMAESTDVAELNLKLVFFQYKYQ